MAELDFEEMGKLADGEVTEDGNWQVYRQRPDETYEEYQERWRAELELILGPDPGAKREKA